MKFVHLVLYSRVDAGWRWTPMRLVGVPNDRPTCAMIRRSVRIVCMTCVGVTMNKKGRGTRTQNAERTVNLGE